jgi:hypothetical protein
VGAFPSKDRTCWLLLAATLTLALSAPSVRAQGPAEPVSKDSVIGYIDSAVIKDQLRLRFDSAYNDFRPTRAEFIYPKGGTPGSPGLPLPEPRVDFQELTSYLEVAFAPGFSAFVEAPVRFINPEVNGNHEGFGDLNAGFKLYLLDTPDWLATFQFRTYAPTGNSHLGLGTNHVSLEPALLVNYQPAERVLVEGELRYWLPIGGTDFAGDIIRYGIGLSYGSPCREGFWMRPVVELIGWTILSGKEGVVFSPTATAIKDAAGETILNIKFGARWGLGSRADFYAGYGRPLTGDSWYKDIWRVEFRLFF